MASHDAIPQKLKEKARFCCWRYENRGGDKPTKVPYNPVTGGKAQSNHEHTFSDFKTALSRVGAYDGLGFRVADGTSALDLDHCFTEDGQMKPWARDVVQKFHGSYMERSPSGKGLRIIFEATGFVFDKDKYFINNQKLGLEVYVSGATHRFVTVTGDIFANGDVTDMSSSLQYVLEKYMKRSVTPPSSPPDTGSKPYLSDDEVYRKAIASVTGGKFSALWNGDTSGYASESEADLALASMLAFWCDRDLKQMDRLFRQSARLRPKWDRPQSGSTYGQITLTKAAKSTSSTYSPTGRKAKVVTAEKGDDGELGTLHPEDNTRYGWNDIGSGNLFADCCKDTARYVPERKMWYTYDGIVWQPDIGNLKTMELCKQLADKLMIHALTIGDEEKRNRYINFVRRWQSRKNRETILKDATGLHPVSISAFDSDPYVLNCLNGTLNLKTGMFHTHRPEDMLSKVSGVMYFPGAHCERWEQFIAEIMQGDQDKAVFLQKALGYALTGDSRYEALFVLYGATTRNGKGTCMETFMRIMGDYGKTARPESIGLKANYNSNHPTEDIARLAGTRFVNISEPDKQLVLSAALVKSLTGNDTINARFLHENSFDYRPQFKLFINTNYLPQVNDLTLFSSGRVKIIPFERHFKDHEQDKLLKSTLSKPDNLSGILNWCIEGYRLLDHDGFAVPESVQEATDDYRHSSDKIGLFIEDAMEPDLRAEVRTSEAYARYRSWCLDSGYKVESIKNFNTALAASMHIERRRPRTGGNMTTMINGYRMLEMELRSSL